MKKCIYLFGSLVLLGMSLIYSCKSGSGIDTRGIATDPASIASGENLFTQNCSSCHNFKQDGIGPHLGGLTEEVDASWITSFIQNPKKMMDAGDQRAVELLKKYKAMMLPFSFLKPEELKNILAYMHTQKKPATNIDTSSLPWIKNPIVDTIEKSSLVLDLQLITQFPASSDSGKMPLTRITKMDFEPKSGTNYVLDLRGKLYRMQGNKYAVYMDMAKLCDKFINQPGLATGFGSFAFHPEFSKNGLIYTSHTEPPKTAIADFVYEDSIKVVLQWVLMEWKAEKPGSPVFTGAGRELLRINVQSGIHGMQELTFNPLAKTGDEDYGLLYFGEGDGGAVEHGYPFIAHQLNRIWGCVLRIDPSGNNSKNGKYGIPATNPFVNHPDPNVVKEIYAYGFRNPHRITWSKAGQMLVSNVGHFNVESLNLILPGHDYGWPIREGTFLVDYYSDLKKSRPLPPDDSSYHITYPVLQYDHDEGKAISGGFEYWGNAVPELKGKFIFGDIPMGTLYYVEMKDIQLGKQAVIKEWAVKLDGIEKPLREICGADRVDLHFARDAKGEIYIMTKPDGKLYKLISSEKKAM